MSATFQNSAMVLSIGIFFTLIIPGLASSLSATLTHGLVAQGVPHADAARVAALPPVSILFAALLGYNPVQTLLGHSLSKLPASHVAYLTGHTFFPSLISAPFEHGLAIAFCFAIAACLVAAVASLLRGGIYVHGVHPAPLTRGAAARAVAGTGQAREPAAGQVVGARLDGPAARQVGTRQVGTRRHRSGADRRADVRGHQSAAEQPSAARRDRSRAEAP
jgi:hypothetical protein